MDISINKQNQERIRRKVESGHYASPDEVIAKALELLDESDKALAEELAEVRAKVQEGVDQLKSGNYTKYDEAGLEELKARIKRQGRERLAARYRQPGS